MNLRITQELITAGIDIGSSTAQAVLVREGQLLGFSNIPAGIDRLATARQALELARSSVGIEAEEIKYVVGTGYGRYQIPFAHKNITEITCHARGANYFFPDTATVLDIGGQDSKVISCGPGGRVNSFFMNERCAAGTGRSMEVISRILKVPLEEIGALSWEPSEIPPTISSGCVVFAKSEALKLLRLGVSRNAILAAYCQAMVSRVLSLVQKVEIKEKLVLTGGVALNTGIVRRLEAALQMRAWVCPEPQIAGALGAALLAQQLYPKSA
jgi:benzoyl-CoA reductase subunit A